jgi:hypothetical protein
VYVKEARVGSYDVAVWRSQDTKGIYNDVYYFILKGADPKTQLIWVWIVSLNADTETGLTTPEVQAILYSFRILN